MYVYIYIMRSYMHNHIYILCVCICIIIYIYIIYIYIPCVNNIRDGLWFILVYSWPSFLLSTDLAHGRNGGQHHVRADEVRESFFDLRIQFQHLAWWLWLGRTWFFTEIYWADPNLEWWNDVTPYWLPPVVKVHWAYHMRVTWKSSLTKLANSIRNTSSHCLAPAHAARTVR